MRKILACVVFVMANMPLLVKAADNFPSRPITLVVPVAAGGTADVLGRLVAQGLSKEYGQNVIVVNKPGAGGNIGGEYVAHSAPDGYTILLGLFANHATYRIYPNLHYQPQEELKVVTVLADMANVIVVNPHVPAKTLPEFMNLANTKKVFFGSAGNGSSTHMAVALFMYDTKLHMTHIPYNGSSEAMNDVIGGRVQTMFENLPTALPMIKSGAVRALAVTSKTRTPLLPDVPTAAEAGAPNYSFTAWMTIAAPSATPPQIIEKLNNDIRKVLAAPELKPRWQMLGITPLNMNAQESQDYIAKQAELWNQVIDAEHLAAKQ